MPDLMQSPFDYFDRFLVLSPASRKLVEEVLERIEVARGTIIVHENKLNPYMYIIAKGAARGFSPEEGEDRTFSLWHELNAFGDVTTYLTGTPAIKSYEILEDSVLFRLDIFRFRALFGKKTELANLGRILVEKYILNQEHTKRLYSGKNARQRFYAFLTEKPGLINRVKSIYIASYLNMKPETYSRIRSRWLKTCSIEKANGIV